MYKMFSYLPQQAGNTTKKETGKKQGDDFTVIPSSTPLSNINSNGLITLGVVNEHNRLIDKRVTDGVMYGDFSIGYGQNFFTAINGGISFPEPLNGTINTNKILADRPVETGNIQNFTIGLGVVNDEKNSAMILQGGKISHLLNPLQSLNENINWTKSFRAEDERRYYRTGLGQLPLSQDTSSWGAKLRAGYSTGLFSAYTTLAMSENPQRDDLKAIEDLKREISPALSLYTTEVTSGSIMDNYLVTWDLGVRLGPILGGFNYGFGKFNAPYTLKSDGSTQEYLNRRMQVRFGLPLYLGDFAFRPAYVGRFEKNVLNKSLDHSDTYEYKENDHTVGAELEYKIADFTVFGTKMPLSVGGGYFYNGDYFKYGTDGVEDEKFHNNKMSAFLNFGSLENVACNLSLESQFAEDFDSNVLKDNFTAAFTFTTNVDFVGAKSKDLDKWVKEGKLKNF